MQSPSLRPAIEQIWSAMGLVAPPEKITNEYHFEADGAQIEMALSNCGQFAEISTELGTLSGMPHDVRRQFETLLRYGLALVALNRAFIFVREPATAAEAGDALERGVENASLPLLVKAVIGSDRAGATEAPDALAAVLQWFALSREVIAGADQPRPARVDSFSQSAQIADSQIAKTVFYP